MMHEEYYFNMPRFQLFWLIPVFLIAYNLAANMSNDIYLPSMPALAQEFATSNNIIQFTLTAWYAGVAIPQLIFGPLAERVGRRLLLFFGGTVFLISCLLCATTQSVQLMIFARLVQGVGVCSLNIVSYTLLRELYSYNDCIKITAYINICTSLAPLIGPIIGGYIFVHVGWRYNFILVLLLSLMALIGLWYTLPETKKQKDLNALHFKVMKSNYKELLHNYHFLRHLTAYCLLLGGLIAFLTGAPFILIKELSVRPDYFGYTQLPVFIFYSLGSIFMNRIVIRFGGHETIKIGLWIIFLSGLAMLYFGFAHLDSVLTFILPMVLYGLGFSLCSSPLTTEILSVGVNNAGYTAALLGFGMALGGTVSTLAISLISNESMLPINIVIVALSILAIFFFNLLPRILLRFKF